MRISYDNSDDESGMARDILFKPRMEATDQKTQNWTFRNPRINESSKSLMGDIAVISFFPFYFTPENIS